MPLRRLEGLLQGWIRHSAEGHGFLLTCGLLAFAGTVTAAYPVTAVVVPAGLLVPRRWLVIALCCAFGSAIGATVLVEVSHHIGWSQLYAWFPHLAESDRWQEMNRWLQEYGVLSLFLIAASPLPQTPALVFFGLTGHSVVPVFVAILLGKILKYGLFAWLTSHFPERFERRENTPPTEKDAPHET